MQLTEQIPIDPPPPRWGAESTTTSNHPSAPRYCEYLPQMNMVMSHDCISRLVMDLQFSLYVHKGGLKPDSFHFILSHNTPLVQLC